MRTLPGLTLVLLSISVPAMAQDFQRQRDLNTLNDIASRQRQLVELARRQAQRDDERAWRERNAAVNAQRDARSARRFDRPSIHP